MERIDYLIINDSTSASSQYRLLIYFCIQKSCFIAFELCSLIMILTGLPNEMILFMASHNLSHNPMFGPTQMMPRLFKICQNSCDCIILKKSQSPQGPIGPRASITKLDTHHEQTVLSQEIDNVQYHRRYIFTILGDLLGHLI